MSLSWRCWAGISASSIVAALISANAGESMGVDLRACDDQLIGAPVAQDGRVFFRYRAGEPNTKHRLQHSKVTDVVGIPKGSAPPRFHLADGISTVGKEDGHNEEIAAYEFDRAAGFYLVPVTVERKVGGRTLSFQQFIEEAQQSASPPSKLLRLFDYLIGNQDRHSENVLEVDGKQIAIDNGSGFAVPYVRLALFGVSDIREILPDRETFERLKPSRLADVDITAALIRWIPPEQVLRVLKRRKIFIDAVETLIKEKGEAYVFGT